MLRSACIRAVGITWTTFAVNDGSQNFFNGWATGLNSVGAANYILPCANFASYVRVRGGSWGGSGCGARVRRDDADGVCGLPGLSWGRASEASDGSAAVA